jgi:hypothetical protein
VRVLLATVLLLLLSVLPVAAEPLDGVVTGQVVNKTAGGTSTAGTTILLVAFGRKEQAPVGQRSTQTDAQGQFSFDGLDRDPNLVYIALARYQNVNYPTEQPFQLQAESTHQADIGVYEATSADDAIQLERLNLLVVGADQGVVQLPATAPSSRPIHRTRRWRTRSSSPCRAVRSASRCRPGSATRT